MKVSQIRTDPQAEINGVWVVWQGDMKVKLARLNNPRYEQTVRDLTQARLLASGTKTLTEDEKELVGCEAIAKAITLDWSGFEEDDGTPVPFTSEKSLEYLVDDEMRDFYRFVLFASSNVDKFRKARQLEALGN